MSPLRALRASVPLCQIPVTSASFEAVIPSPIFARKSWTSGAFARQQRRTRDLLFAARVGCRLVSTPPRQRKTGRPAQVIPPLRLANQPFLIDHALSEFPHRESCLLRRIEMFAEEMNVRPDCN